MKESSGTAFMIYGLAWGINQGLLAKETYLPAVRKGWPALASVVDTNGKVQWGQPPGVGPAAVTQESSNTHTAVFFYWQPRNVKLDE